MSCMSLRVSMARSVAPGADKMARAGHPGSAADGSKPALAVALEGMSPITDAIASGWYRAEVLPVHLGRLLLA